MSTEWSQQPSPIRALVIICVALEIADFVAQIAGFGTQIRNLMIAFGGFWPGILRGDPELYPGQTILMFATSAVLHGGLLHLFMNMVGLMWFGPMVYARAGQRAFLSIIGLSALGSGVSYVVLSQGDAPMVGASGVLFGLVGVLGMWELRDRLSAGAGLRLFLQQALALLALNVVFSFLAGGVVAWQAHLGGLLAGALCAIWTWRRSR